MTTPASPVVDLDQPHDTCARCGRPTPLGVALCDDDNPGHLRGPSATQMHGTIVAGVGVGLVFLALLANLAFGGIGPFSTRVLASAALPSGGVDVVFTVTNDGGKTTAATCRITRGGVSTTHDPVFRTDPVEPGGTIQVTRTLQPPASGDPPLVPERLTIHCA